MSSRRDDPILVCECPLLLSLALATPVKHPAPWNCVYLFGAHKLSHLYLVSIDVLQIIKNTRSNENL